MQVTAGTEVVVVAQGADPGLRVTTICSRVADYVTTGQVPLAIRSCDLVYDWSPDGILTNGYTGTWTIAPTVDMGSLDAVRQVMAGVLWVATGTYPQAVSIARVGGQSTGETVPAASTGGLIGHLGEALTAIVDGIGSLASATPLVLVGVLATVAVILILIARSPASLRAARAFV